MAMGIEGLDHGYGLVVISFAVFWTSLTGRMDRIVGTIQNEQGIVNIMTYNDDKYNPHSSPPHNPHLKPTMNAQYTHYISNKQSQVVLNDNLEWDS